MSDEDAANASGDEPATAVAAQALAALDDELRAARRDIHADPELSGCEVRTTAVVAKRLRASGLRPRLLPGRTGLICDIGRGKRTIALRADLDALPLTDLKDVP